MAGRLAIADMEDKDALIQELREELTLLERQLDEFNEIRLSIVKVSGKNSVRKLKTTVLTPSDRLNAHIIGETLRIVLWPHIKMMPLKWYKWSDNPKSISQCILGSIGMPKGFTKEEYWLSVALSAANEKLCTMRSNLKQTMARQFKGEISLILGATSYRCTNILGHCPS